MQVAFKIKMIMHATLHSRIFIMYYSCRMIHFSKIFHPKLKYLVFYGNKSVICCRSKTIYTLKSWLLYFNLMQNLINLGWHISRSVSKQHNFFYFSHGMNILISCQKTLAPPYILCNPIIYLLSRLPGKKLQTFSSASLEKNWWLFSSHIK